jgi:hypothetical protein
MGRGTKAKIAAVATQPEPTDDRCCLPYCDEPGQKLLCGHRLCAEDLLRLAIWPVHIGHTFVECPMCRETQILKPRVVRDALDEMPFRAAVMACCSDKDCRNYVTVVLRPCASHGSHTCKVCEDERREDAAHVAFTPCKG